MKTLLWHSTQAILSRRSLLIALFPLMLFFAGSAPPAWGQQAAKIENLTIALWPDYDRPAVLVTYRVTLAPEVAFPVAISLPVPAQVGRPHAVAKSGPDGRLYHAEFTMDVEGDWASVNVTTDSPVLQLEYYAPFSSSTGARIFSFDWPGGLKIENFGYEILQPKYATNLVVLPSPTEEAMSDLGVPLLLAELGARSAAQKETIALTYNNASSQLTVAPAAAPKMPDFPTAVSPGSFPETLPIEQPESGTSSTLVVFAVLGVFAAFIIGIWLGRKGGSDSD